MSTSRAVLRRFKEEFLLPIPKALRSTRRNRGGAISGYGDETPFDPRDVLETHAEVQLGDFLKPYSVSKLAEVVHQLTGAGFTSRESLRALDPEQCSQIGLSGDDTERLLLASWLDIHGLTQYAEGLVASGVRSPLQLLVLSDSQLVRAGIRLIGHRRQMFRHLREDEALQERRERVRAEEEKADRERRHMMSRSSGGLISSPSKKQPAGSSATASASGAGNASTAVARGKRPAEGSASSALQPPPEPPRSLLRFEVIPPGGVGAIDEQPSEHELATGGDLGARLWTDNLWAMPWRTTGNAALLGAAPGALAEAHCEARTPRDGFELVGLDGRVMRVW